MSLLMDALRKAELEKKEAAKRLEETAGHLQNEEGEQNTPDSEPRPPEDITSEEPITRLDRTIKRSREEIFAATARLSLEPIEQINEETPRVDSEEPTIQIPIEPGPETQVEETISDESIPLDITSQHLQTGDYTDTGSDYARDETLQELSMEEEKQVPGLYDETLQGEPYRPGDFEGPYDETLPGIPAVELAKDLGEEHQPTPVAAETVFTATATTTAAQGFKWPVIIGLAVVVIIAFSVLVYQAVTPLVRDIPTQQLTGDLALLEQSVEEIKLPAPEAGPGVQAGTGEGITGETIQPSTAEEPGAGETQIQADEISGAVIAGRAEEDLGAITPPETEEPVSMADESAGRAPEAMPQPLTLEPGLIKISRSRAPDPRGSTIMEAFTAYKNGDYGTARTKYEEVLDAFPDNRDALLGLGAIAMREGDYAGSYDIYSHLFRTNPRDSVARAILINFNKQADYVNRESTLKIMINDDPDNAFLYFSLGNVYASQTRWAEAQQAFFNAYKYDSGNPDYALNLAVSLDHLGQSATAVDYYNTALKLSDENSAGFDSAVILTRIQSLKTRM